MASRLHLCPVRALSGWRETVRHLALAKQAYSWLTKTHAHDAVNGGWTEALDRGGGPVWGPTDGRHRAALWSAVRLQVNEYTYPSPGKLNGFSRSLAG